MDGLDRACPGPSATGSVVIDWYGSGIQSLALSATQTGVARAWIGWLSGASGKSGAIMGAGAAQR